jgi:hypothetical protein
MADNIKTCNNMATYSKLKINNLQRQGVNQPTDTTVQRNASPTTTPKTDQNNHTEDGA